MYFYVVPVAAPLCCRAAACRRHTNLNLYRLPKNYGRCREGTTARTLEVCEWFEFQPRPYWLVFCCWFRDDGASQTAKLFALEKC